MSIASDSGGPGRLSHQSANISERKKPGNGLSFLHPRASESQRMTEIKILQLRDPSNGALVRNSQCASMSRSQYIQPPE